MDSLQQRFTAQMEEIDRMLSGVGFLNTAEKTTKVNKVWIASALLGILSLCLFFGLGANLLCNLVGFLYPAYESFKAIESENREDRVQWLIYWVVFGVFHIAESGVEILLAWFPFYYAFKLGFLVYCFLPSTRGAQFVYGNIIKPFLESHQVRFGVEKPKSSVNDRLYPGGEGSGDGAYEASKSAERKKEK